MINQDALKTYEDAINSRTCPICGEAHHVALRQNSTHSFANSSTVMLATATGDKIFVEVEDGACEGFMTRICSFLAPRLYTIITSPFDKF